MPMGSSAGRSSKHKIGEGAPARLTDRQRLGIDPPVRPVPITKARRTREDQLRNLGIGLIYLIMTAGGIALVLTDPVTGSTPQTWAGLVLISLGWFILVTPASRRW